MRRVGIFCFADKMRGAFVVFLFMHVVVARANIIVKAKFIGNWRVSGDSIVMRALSISHCLAICNKEANCDAITYYDELNKCRLFKRCSPLHVIGGSSHYWFYAKRPPVRSDGYFYEEFSDSCFKVNNRTSTYEESRGLCAEERAYLAVLHTPLLRKLGAEMLKVFGRDEAWINAPFKSYEKFAKNKERQTERKVLNNGHTRNSYTSECWILQKYEPVNVPSCNGEKKFSICQLPPY